MIGSKDSSCVMTNLLVHGLQMIDPYTFSMAEKMSWVKLLLDDNYESLWKSN